MMTVILSRRNLLTLLNKLDRVSAGGQSACTLIKVAENENGIPTRVAVHAQEDADTYRWRNPGPVLPDDDPDTRLQ